MVLSNDNLSSRKVAAITGAASGIGEAYAKKLAALNYDLLLIDKNKRGLQRVQSEIKKAHGINAEIMTADLSKEIDLKKVENRIRKSRINILVNNAGFSTGQDFCETEEAVLDAMLKVHVDATVRFTRAILPEMVKHNEGTIINISSITVFIKNKRENVAYTSTKRFIKSFSESLSLELGQKSPGIKVQVLCPGYTRTNFLNSDTIKVKNSREIPSWMLMTPEEVVEESIKALKKKKTVVIPGRMNKVIVFLFKSRMVRAFSNFIVDYA